MNTFALLFACLFIWTSPVKALEIPPPPATRVTDHADLLKPDYRGKLEKQLANFEKKTTHQIVVVVFSSLEGENMEDFTRRLMNQWRVGQKGKNNGVGIIIFYKDRKIRIEVGEGISSILTDDKSKDILEKNIIPFFKKGKFEEGISSGVQAIFRVLGNKKQ